MTDVIEKLARQMILSFKGDPDMLVQPGTPQVYGTPAGDAFAITPPAAVPMWTLYKATARNVYEIAKTVIEQDKPGQLLESVKPFMLTGVDRAANTDTITGKA